MQSWPRAVAGIVQPRFSPMTEPHFRRSNCRVGGCSDPRYSPGASDEHRPNHPRRGRHVLRKLLPRQRPRRRTAPSGAHRPVAAALPAHDAGGRRRQRRHAHLLRRHQRVSRAEVRTVPQVAPLAALAHERPRPPAMGLGPRRQDPSRGRRRTDRVHAARRGGQPGARTGRTRHLAQGAWQTRRHLPLERHARGSHPPPAQ
jgi:hypothetical protein